MIAVANRIFVAPEYADAFKRTRVDDSSLPVRLKISRP